MIRRVLGALLRLVLDVVIVRVALVFWANYAARADPGVMGAIALIAVVRAAQGRWGLDSGRGA